MIEEQEIIDLAPDQVETKSYEELVTQDNTLVYPKVIGASVEGGTINQRKTTTITDAINDGGNFIKDVINARFDTSTKEILSDFTFGTSGAIKMITDDNNGLWISPTGLLGKKAGNTTFSIDTSGNATFAGDLSAASGTLGTITAGTFDGVDITGTTITGGTFQTSYHLIIYEAAGATSPTAANGDYYKEGLQGGKAAYTNGAYWIWWDTGDSHWKVSNAKGSGDVQFDKFTTIFGTYDNVNGSGTFVVTHVGNERISLNELDDGYLRFYDQFGVLRGYISDHIYMYDSNESFAGTIQPLTNLLAIAADKELALRAGTEGITINRNLLPSANGQHFLGTSSLYFNGVYADAVRYKSLDSFEEHDDISLMKKIKEKEVTEKGKKKFVWDYDTMPKETKSEEFYDAGAVQGFLIGTVKQLIGEVEDLKKQINLLKVSKK
jgi:hypothetical protein